MSSQHQSDDELLASAARGDRNAASRLVERYRERLLRMVCVWLEQEPAPHIDPEDLVRQSMATALEQLITDHAIQVAALARVRRCDGTATGVHDFKPFFLWLRDRARQQFSRLRQAVGEGSESAPRPAEPNLFSEPAAERLAQELFLEDSATLNRLLKKEIRRRLAAVLAHLGRSDRELLMLRHLEGLSAVECAVVLGISEEAVKVRYVEVLGRLKQLLND